MNLYTISTALPDGLAPFTQVVSGEALPAVRLMAEQSLQDAGYVIAHLWANGGGTVRKTYLVNDRTGEMATITIARVQA